MGLMGWIGLLQFSHNSQMGYGVFFLTHLFVYMDMGR